MIELSALRFAYDTTGAHEADRFILVADALSLPAGSRTALVGPSGAGKTTLLQLIAGIRVPQQGRVVVDGQDVAAMKDAARRKFRRSSVGLVFQTIELLDYLSLADNILLPYRLSGGLSAAAKERAADTAARLSLGALMERGVTQLSQGERQRAAICRALAGSPKVLLVDEPTRALDDDNTAAAMDLLFESAEHHGTTLLVLTHDKALLPRFDQVIALKAGRIENEGGGA